MASNIKITILVVSAMLLAGCSQYHNIERKNYYSWENEYGYAQVVKAGNTLYISGIASNKPNMPEQIQEIYTYITRILNDYGVDSDALVKQVIYTKDIEMLKAETALRKSFFNENRYPSSSIVQIERLYDEEHLLEVEIVAVLPK
tara:strand:- start:836 stop:1270 length:435 start_codon:yes stop_codon:yes gene_type:complete